MSEDNVYFFPPPKKDQMDEVFRFSDDEIKRQVRAKCAAVVGLLQKPNGQEDLERCLHLLNEAWGELAAVFIFRGEKE